MAQPGEPERGEPAGNGEDAYAPNFDEIFKAFGREPLTIDEFHTALAAAGSRAEEPPLPGDTAAMTELRRQARRAEQEGRLDEADNLLGELYTVQGEAPDRRPLEQADTAGRRGQLALGRMRHADAARHFALAAETVPATDPTVRLGYRWNEAAALQAQGLFVEDDAALELAISRWQDLLLAYPRAESPEQWANVQDSLAFAYSTLGERQPGTVALEQAVGAYRNRLLEFTRERHPLTWARIQVNIGIAFREIGEREGSSAKLAEAVQTLRDALLEATRETRLGLWGYAEENLSVTLEMLGRRERNKRLLVEARVAFLNAWEAVREVGVVNEFSAYEQRLADLDAAIAALPDAN